MYVWNIENPRAFNDAYFTIRHLNFQLFCRLKLSVGILNRRKGLIIHSVLSEACTRQNTFKQSFIAKYNAHYGMELTGKKLERLAFFFWKQATTRDQKHDSMATSRRLVPPLPRTPRRCFISASIATQLEREIRPAGYLSIFFSPFKDVLHSKLTLTNPTIR